VSGATTIEWTERTWNPTTGCDRVSPGCAHCYALTMAARLRAMGNPRYQLDGDDRTSGPGFLLTAHDDLVDAPRTWSRPSLVFVNSMSDLFHEDVPLEFIERVFDTVAETPRHTYQVLTKRHERLVELAPHLPWPSNLWMGVSIENRRFVERADHLREVPAAVRFISAEPLLGPLEGLTLEGIDWLIVGGESGARARRMELAWARDLVERCRAAGVAVFVKQLGSVWAGRGKGGDPALWPEDLRVRETPAGSAELAALPRLERR
jgi:protein gp37